MLNSHLVLKQEDRKACGDLGINITICHLPRVRLLRRASQRPGYAVSPLPHLPWTLELPPLSPRIGIWILLCRHSLGQLIWLSSNGCLRFNEGLPIPEPHLHFTRPVFPVLSRQARDSCAPFRAPASVLHLSAASRMSECSLKGTFVPVES